MKSLIDLLKSQHQQILSALGQHILLSLTALLIATFIAVPLAIILKNHRRLAEIMLQITGILQTIPSLALLGMLIPLVGIGTVPSIVALVIYAIMPIYQSTDSGLTGIDSSLEEAGIAFGLTRFERLWNYELPLAMPIILSGIRIAVVLVIGTATLAALIGAGGLGSYILLGIETNNNDLLIIGAVLSALLALIFSGLIKLIAKLSLKKLLITIIGLFIIVGSGITYQSLNSLNNKSIIIAGKLGSEPEILINMYKQLIQEQSPHQKVILKSNFGTTEFLSSALRNHQIDIYPEFTGTVLEAIIKKPQLINASPQKTYQQARINLRHEYNWDYLTPMKYQNGYALSVRADFAKRYHLKTITDLQKVSPKIKAGFDNDFAAQPDGYKGISKHYHLKFKFSTMSPAIRYQAIANDKVNLVDGYTTDPQIRQYHLVMLKDNKHFFPPYQGAPLMTTAFAQQHPQVVKALQHLDNKISNADMQKMNYLVSVKHQNADSVANHYLVTHHLLK